MISYEPATLLALAVAMSANTAIACDGLSATGAWVREPPPVANVAAGYVTLQNTDGEPLSIAQIESDCCGSVMMHDNLNDGDRVRMVHLHSLRLEAGESADFTPGGKHLMLMAPRSPIRSGDSIELEFVCNDGGIAQVEFAVRKVK